VDLAAIPLERVESIEILRGAASSLYGPGAAAGAVIIHLRRAARRQIVLAGTVGSGGYGEADAQLDEPRGEQTVSLHLNHRQSAGEYLYYDAQAASAATTTPAPGNACAEPRGDGYFLRKCNKRQVDTLSLDWRSGEKRRIGLELEHSERQGLGGVEDAQPFGQERRDRLRVVYADALPLPHEGGGAPELGWQASAQRLISSRSANVTLGEEGLTGRFTDDRADGDLWWEAWLGRHKNRLGASLGRQALDDRYFQKARDKAAVYDAWSYHPDEGTVEASARLDALSDLPAQGTWRVALSRLVAWGFGVKASQATGYRPPTLYELYDPGAPGGVSAANPDLRPESSRSTDGGIFVKVGDGVYAELQAFRQEVRNDIVAVADPTSPTLFRLQNVFRTRSTGLEATVSLRLPGGFDMDGAWTRMAALILDNDPIDPRDNGNRVPGVPDLRWNAALNWRHQGWHAFLSTRYSGRRFVDTANTRFLRAYQVADTGLAVPVGRGFETGLEVRNLTNATYVELENQPPPGRQYFLTLRWRLSPVDRP
jgi:vitamin B12 transporter